MLERRGDPGTDKEGHTKGHASNRQEGREQMPMNLLRCMYWVTKVTKKTQHLSSIGVSNHQINELPN